MRHALDNDENEFSADGKEISVKKIFEIESETKV